MSLWIGRLYFYLGFSRHYSMKELKSCGMKPDYEKTMFLGLKLGFFRVGIGINMFEEKEKPTLFIHLYLGFLGIYLAISQTIRKKDILKNEH